MTTQVKIERGVLSSYFQVARSWLSAASAELYRDQDKAVAFIDATIDELKALKRRIKAAAL